jgi:lysophospholipase L1-like esterase
MRAARLNIALVSLCLCVSLALAATEDHWVGTWGVPLQGTPPQTITVKNQTVRHRLEISVGGPRLRIQLSNEFGSKPLVIGAASVAMANRDGSVKPGTFAQIRFGGSPKVIIPPGERMVSDAVDFKTEALQNLAVSLYLPEGTVLSTYFQEERRSYEQIGYSPSSEPTLMGSLLSAEGDFTMSASMPMPQKSVQIYSPFLAEIDTVARKGTPVVVVYGDTKSHGADMWPNYLRRRISPSTGGGVAVVNKSLWAGTLTLYQPYGTAMTRFDRDVLAVAGVTHVLFFNASNDVNMPGMNGNRAADVLPTTAITLAMQQIIERSHAAGVKVIGATLIPFEGVLRPGYATPEHMRQRNEVNAWIRTAYPFDAMVDFDAVVRDPGHPERLLPAYDGGNHFTPSEAGMRALAKAIDVGLFKK